MKYKLLVLGLMILGYYFRIYGVDADYSFWSDESHVAIFSRALLNRGWPQLDNGYDTGVYQILLYWLTALSMVIFGVNEHAARFPSVLFGVATIGIVYLLGKEIFNKKVGLLASAMIAFMNIEILWSRQARPYQALQLFAVVGAIYVYRIAIGRGNLIKNFLWFTAASILALGFHGLGIIILLAGFSYLAISNLKKYWVFLPIGMVAIICSDIIFGWQSWVLAEIFKNNNLFYYRVFLTHNYPSIILFGVLGLLWLFLIRDHKKLLLFLSFIVPQLIIVSFVLPQPFTRYLYIIFPFIITLSSYSIFQLTNIINNPKRLTINKAIRLLIIITPTALLLIPLFIQGKLSLLPLQYYSLNSDMQEIPEVDYRYLYQAIKEKRKEFPGTIYLSNWNDHAIWYLGEGNLSYRLRNNPLQKITDPVSGAKYISTVDDLRSVVSTEKRGIVLLESWETELPMGMDKYIHNNLKKELEIDRLYPIQPRYWTVWVYSWGLE